MNDINDSQELLEAERAARADAERKNQLKDEFLAMVSHELRTPLAAVLGWSQVLRGEGAARDYPSKALEAIEHNALAQARILDDLLDVGRMISGKLHLELRPVHLGPVLEAAAQSLWPAAAERQVHFQSLFAPNVPTVLADRDRLEQVFRNLISNAIKFSPRGGQVDVTLRRIDDAAAQVSVRDAGEGIEPGSLPHLFDRFWQAAPSAARRGGLGLGLAVVKQLVELHGGHVRVHSEGLGKGCEFVVTLPLAPSVLQSQ